MNILALDTSMGACSAAILRAEGDALRLHARQEAMARGHAEALMPMVAELLAEAGLAASELDLIAATAGPGSFTGVRIAIAAARGLALATRAKLYGTDSLSVMARVALMSGALPDGPFAVAVDARRGMLYLGLFDETGRRRDGPLLIAPDEAGAPSACRSWHGGRQRRIAARRGLRATRSAHRDRAARASAERCRAG